MDHSHDGIGRRVPAAQQPGAHDHVVQFYEDDGYLADVVARYSANALRSGGVCVWIATAGHRALFLERLKLAGVDVEEAQRSGLLVVEDAAATLEKFMTQGRPDGARFNTTIGALLDSLPRGRPVYAYGEMVDVLWRDGQPRAALTLEALWNELSALRDFRLLCAYTMKNFPTGSDGDPFREVCAAHSHVVPTEDYSRIESEESRRREVSSLQQRAAALEHEIEVRRRFERQLTEALRLRDDFVAVAGHELRTPLTSLSLLVQKLRRMGTTRKDSELLFEIDRVQRQTERLTALAEELLDVSRLSGGALALHREACDLGNILQEVVSANAEQINRSGCEVSLSIQEHAAGQWDRLRMEQVVTNLLGNALKYGAGKPVELSVELDRGRARLSVRDHGHGVALEDQARIFNRFERAVSAEHFGGLGLGLWITRQLVEAHGGVVRVDSESGQGSTFIVELPASAPAN